MNAIMVELMEKLDIDMKGKVSIQAVIIFPHCSTVALNNVH
jgi:hypothetical protein